MNPDLLAKIKKILSAIESKKGLEPVVLDVRSLVSYTDFLIICSGSSSTQVAALVDGIQKSFPKGEGPVYTNPSRDDSWWILDFVDVVVHVFGEREREYYNLENLWGDAKKIGNLGQG